MRQRTAEWRPDPTSLREAMRQYRVAIAADYLQTKWSLPREEAVRRALALHKSEEPSP